MNSFKNIRNKLKSVVKKNPGGVMALGIFVIAFSVLLIGYAFAALIPTKSIIITSHKTSFEDKEQGSWQVEKSGKWIERGKAEVTFDVSSTFMKQNEYTDVIFVLDISGSMEGERISHVKSDTKELLNTLLETKGNRASVISFSNDSQILSGLKDDKSNLNSVIENLEVTGDTNYYQALVDVEELLKGYKKENNRDLVVLFLTDGYPNIDSPNEVTQFTYLKEKYPYVTFNGVQYEMGDIVLDPIKKISDNQFIADMDSLHNVLYDAALPPKEYDKFQIIDYVDSEYFTLESVDDITVTDGNVKLENVNGKQKITWNLDGLKSGSDDVKLTMKLDLKDDYFGTGGIYPTNESEEVISKIDGNGDEDIVSTKTPILSEKYRVIYDGNAPDGCSVSEVPSSEDYLVFDTVSLSTKELSCVGYKFNGWEITNKGITKTGDDHFIMPEEDVIIKAKWSKLDISKTMDGDVSQIMSLYDIMAKQSVMDNEKSEFVSSSSGIDFSRGAYSTNGKGVYERAGTENDEYPIYYYRGEIDNNHVKFANFCWKAVRTTDTGGVKLIYDGVPDENGYCNNAGKASQIGESDFNPSNSSPAYVGYMYGADYGHSNKWLGVSFWYEYVNKEHIYITGLADTNYYYSDSVTYENGVYVLNNPKKYIWSDHYQELDGYYTCRSEDATSCEIVSFADMTYTSAVYYVNMSNGETYDSLEKQAQNVKWIYGNDVSWNGNSYILKNTTQSSPMNYEEEGENVIQNGRRYTCFSENGSCESVYYVLYTTSDYVCYIKLSNGLTIETALNEMFNNDNNLQNQTDSTIKQYIDTWYSENMIDYTKYLEDTIWCNDRNIYQLNVWNKDYVGTDTLKFSPVERKEVSYVPSLSCTRLVDSFTVSEENGNGKLTYPVALLTSDEVMLAGEGYNLGCYLDTGNTWWTMSPVSFSSNILPFVYYFSYGRLQHASVWYGGEGVRPAVSLANYMLVVRGDGSSEHPYEVMSEEELYG